MSNSIDITTNSPSETIEFGHKLGSKLKGGEVIALCGPLGSGKTHLIKGIAAGAGANDQSHINSPTFVIVNEYAGRLDIYHIDAYRLDTVSEFETLGFDDFCYEHRCTRGRGNAVTQYPVPACRGGNANADGATLRSLWS